MVLEQQSSGQSEALQPGTHGVESQCYRFLAVETLRKLLDFPQPQFSHLQYFAGLLVGLTSSSIHRGAWHSAWHTVGLNKVSDYSVVIFMSSFA